MTARVATDQSSYSPGQIATATAHNVEPPYTIRCIVAGIVEGTSEDMPLHVDVKTEWAGGVMHFELVKDGNVVDQTDALVN